jgi:hypothetical protein
VKTSSTSVYHKAKESDVLSKAGTGLKRAGTVTFEAGSNLKEKISEAHVGDKVMSAAGKIKDGGLFLGGYLATKAKAAGSAINEKIESNPKLSNAKDVTKEKVGQAASYVSSGLSSLYSKVVKKKENTG